jgi:asparagine synthase (glutamine-hydrolysing)
MSAIYGALGAINDNAAHAMGSRLVHRGANVKVERVSNEVILGICTFKGEENSYLQEDIVRSGCYTVVADSSIYNKRELQEHLARNKYHVQATCNEELIVALYQMEGLEGIEKINGDFSFVIWDDRRKELIFGRDRLGARPLYYTFLSSGKLAFASEYKALLTLPELEPEIDLDMVQHLQHCKLLPNGRTLFGNIHSVPSAGLTRIDSRGVLKDDEQMPSIPMRIEYLSENEYVKKITDSFLHAVDARISDQGKVGVTLSGGIDSIAVTSVYRKLYPDAEIHTFTAGYGSDDPEMATAAIVAERMKTVHHEIITPPDIIEGCLHRIVWHMEDPIQRSETVQLYEVAREARNYVEVLLLGLASDALFAGMPRHKILWIAKKAPFLKTAMEEFYNLTQMGVRPGTFLGKAAAFLYFRRNLPDVPKINGSTYCPKTFKFPEANREFINVVLSSIFQKAIPTALPKIERNFSAWGIKYSSPFFDKKMIETGFCIPDSLKIRRFKEKYILRSALKSIVPREVLSVPKFPQRMKNDAAFSDVLDSIGDRILSKEVIEKRGFYDWADIEKIRASKGRNGYVFEASMRLWTAILTEIWAKEFIDKRGEGPPEGDSSH